MLCVSSGGKFVAKISTNDITALFFFWWGLLNHVSIMHPRVGLSNKKAAVGNMLFVFFCRVFVILSLTNGRRGYIFPLSRKSYNTTLKTDAFKISRA